jgi:hypothetical protein
MARSSRGLSESFARRIRGCSDFSEVSAMGQYQGVIRGVSEPFVNHRRLASLEGCAAVCLSAFGHGMVFLDFGMVFTY